MQPLAKPQDLLLAYDDDFTGLTSTADMPQPLEPAAALAVPPQAAAPLLLGGGDAGTGPDGYYEDFTAGLQRFVDQYPRLGGRHGPLDWDALVVPFDGPAPGPRGGADDGARSDDGEPDDEWLGDGGAAYGPYGWWRGAADDTLYGAAEDGYDTAGDEPYGAGETYDTADDEPYAVDGDGPGMDGGGLYGAVGGDEYGEDEDETAGPHNANGEEPREAAGGAGICRFIVGAGADDRHDPRDGGARAVRRRSRAAKPEPGPAAPARGLDMYTVVLCASKRGEAETDGGDRGANGPRGDPPGPPGSGRDAAGGEPGPALVTLGDFIVEAEGGRPVAGRRLPRDDNLAVIEGPEDWASRQNYWDELTGGFDGEMDETAEEGATFEAFRAMPLELNRPEPPATVGASATRGRSESP
jgi:hypothetical protein